MKGELSILTKEKIKKSGLEQLIEEEVTMAKESKTIKKSIYELLEEEINALDLSDSEKNIKLSKLIRIRNQKLNIMLVGATGVGKSSTINALFDMEVAKVGVGVDPETSKIVKYDLDNLTIWDTPGLGDGEENDKTIRKSILKKINEVDDEGNMLIDLVLVVVDSASKDLGTTYDLIKDILIPAFDEEAKDRILIALNQADMAMKGNHWNDETNSPDDVLKDFLKKKCSSVRNRIKDTTGIDVKPVYYCAGYTDENGEQRSPYNLTKLLYYIVKSIPSEKRMVIADYINDTEDNWLYDDEKTDYKAKIQKSFGDSILECIIEDAVCGNKIGGQVLGIPGRVVGTAVGLLFGLPHGLITAVING